MTLRFSELIKPRTIAGQVVLLVAASVVLFHLAMLTAMQLAQPDDEHPMGFRHDVDRFAGFARMLDGLPEGERAPVAAAMARAYPRLDLALHRSSESVVRQAAAGDPGLADLRRHLEGNLGVFTPADQSQPGERSTRRRVGVGFRDGAAVTGVLPLGGLNGPPASTLILGSIGFMVLNLAVLLWWATRGLTAPLTRLAQAAAGFSLDRDPALLPERGPYEVRMAAHAMNRMQERIRRLVEDRTRMLAAVSHDLRTPITRLRLRAEFIEDGTTRTQILRDLDQMSAMIHAALSYLRDGQTTEGRSLMDLASLLQTICGEFADVGHAVSYQGPDHLVVLVRSDEISRAVANLVENGVKWGTRVIVRLSLPSANAVDIDVVDDGPGIPGDKEAMLQPFARGDAARGMNEPSGFGLGLSITRAIAEAHGGGLFLLDAEPTGLIARLRLPAMWGG